MKLKDYLEILSRRKWIITITTLTVLVVVSIGMVITPPVYSATTKLRIMTATTGGIDYVQYDLSYTERLMQTYIEIAKSVPVIRELENRLATEGIMDKIKVEIIPNTELIAISVEDTDPTLTTTIANALADVLIARSRELYPNANVETVTVMELASLPTVPIKPNMPFLLVLGLLFGLFGGVGLAFVVESLDTVLYSVKQIDLSANQPLLGDIPDYKYPIRAGDLLINNILQAEAFRRLRTNVFFSSKNKDLRTFLVTSAVAGDGKTSVISNLAVSVAKTGRKVLLIDADFRKPALHTVFGLENETGLSSVLDGKSKLNKVIQSTHYAGVDLIASGPLPEDPAEMLGLPALSESLAEIKDTYDIVLIDVAGSLTVTDPAVIAPYVDGVLLIVRLGWVRRGALEDTINNLNNVNANMIGIIVNRTNRGVGTRADKKITTQSGQSLEDDGTKIG